MMTTQPTTADVAQLLNALRSFGLSKAELYPALPMLSVHVLARGAHFLSAGQRAERAGLLIYGFMREYYVLEDRSERTKAFVFAGEVTGSAADLLSGRGSMTNIIAERPSRIASLSLSDLLHLRKVVPGWDQLVRSTFERVLIRKSEREYELLALDAAQRYQRLLAERPDIERLVQARHLASYLGITPVHFSRLRRRRALAAAQLDARTGG